jgi:hypothetical protein
LATLLRTSTTQPPAIPPAFPWLDPIPPDAPTLAIEGTNVRLTPGSAEEPYWWIVHTFDNVNWSQAIRPGSIRAIPLNGARAVRVRAADRAFNLSTPARWP